MVLAGIPRAVPVDGDVASSGNAALQDDNLYEFVRAAGVEDQDPPPAWWRFARDVGRAPPRPRNAMPVTRAGRAPVPDDLEPDALKGDLRPCGVRIDADGGQLVLEEPYVTDATLSCRFHYGFIKAPGWRSPCAAALKFPSFSISK